MRQDAFVRLRPGYRSVPELARDLRHALLLADGEVERGQLAGLTAEAGSALFDREAEVSDGFRAGFIVGRLYRCLLDKGRPLDRKTMPAIAVYGASIAQAAVAGALDPPDAATLLKEHMVACVRVSRHAVELDETSERIALLWLADELRLPPTADLLARWRDLRERRIARLGAK